MLVAATLDFLHLVIGKRLKRVQIQLENRLQTTVGWGWRLTEHKILILWGLILLEMSI